MIAGLKQRWRQLRDAPPGQRFVQQYQSGGAGRRSAPLRALRLAAGVAVTLIGVVLMPAPGPGTLIVALGLSLLAHESLAVARLLDAAELRLRSLWWRLLRRK